MFVSMAIFYNYVVNTLRVRKGYRTLVVSHTAFLYGEAPQSQIGSVTDRDFSDVTGLLWKTCFYKQIVEFRGSLRRHANQLDILGQQVREQPSVEEFRIQEQQERIYIARLTQAFLSFLSDSIAFYQKMVAEVRFVSVLTSALMFDCSSSSSMHAFSWRTRLGRSNAVEMRHTEKCAGWF